MRDNGSERRGDQNLTQTFSLPGLRFLCIKGTFKSHFFSVPLDLERNGVAFASHNPPMDAGPHAAPFCHALPIDFEYPIPRTQHREGGGLFVHLSNNGCFLRFALRTAYSPNDGGERQGQSKTE